MMIRKISGAVLLGLVVLVLSIPFWLPLNGYIPRIEQEASKALGMPVTLTGIRAHLLPTPRVALHGIRIGKDVLAELPKVVIVPEVFTLLDEVKVIERIIVESPRLQAQALGALGALAGTGDSQRVPAFGVRLLEIADATLSFPAFKLSHVDGTVEMREHNTLRQARFMINEDEVVLNLTPADGHFALRATAKEWKLPAGQPIVITKLDATGKLSTSALEIDSLSSRILGGDLTGTATFAWVKGLRLRGKFKVQRMDLGLLLTAIQRNARFGGRLDAHGEFNAQGQTANALLSAMVVTADFDVQQGVLHGVDLLDSVKGLLGGNAKPGDTKFDQLKGHVETGAAGADYTDLSIESGSLRAKGAVFVAKDKSLDGDAKVELKGTASLIGTPELAISGTTDSPLVYPSKAAMAGAAIGTAVLGPGLGTSLGMKAGEIAKKLFGGGSKKGAPPPSKSPKQSSQPR